MRPTTIRPAELLLAIIFASLTIALGRAFIRPGIPEQPRLVEIDSRPILDPNRAIWVTNQNSRIWIGPDTVMIWPR